MKALALLCLLPTGVPDSEIETAVAAIIAHEGDAELQLRSLQGLGEGVLPPLWEHVTRALEPRQGPSYPTDELAWRALASFDRSALRSLLATALSEDPTMPERLGALRLIEGFGTGADLLLALRAATPVAGPMDPGLSRALGTTVQAMLTRDRLAFRAVQEHILEAHPDARFAIVRSVGSVGSVSGGDRLDLLGFLLGFDETLDPVLLAQIGLVAQDVPKPVDEQLTFEVRKFLDRDDPGLVRSAARAAAELGDTGAVGRLVDLLDHEDRGVASSAHWALCYLSGAAFPLDSRRWRGWYRTETRWFEREARDLFDDLSSPERFQIVQALGQLSLHQMHRHEIAEAVTVTLHDPDAAVRRLGCSALRQLGSATAIAELVNVLADEDEGVAREAWQALRAITRRDLPCDPAAWVELVDGIS